MELLLSFISDFSTLPDKWVGFIATILGTIFTILASVYISNFSHNRDREIIRKDNNKEVVLLMAQLKRELELINTICDEYSKVFDEIINDCKENCSISISTVDRYVTIYPQILSRLFQLNTNFDSVVMDAYLAISLNSKDFISTITPSKLERETANCLIFKNVNKLDLINSQKIYTDISDISGRAVNALTIRIDTLSSEPIASVKES